MPKGFEKKSEGFDLFIFTYFYLELNVDRETFDFSVLFRDS